MPKAPSISLTKGIEATKLHPRTGNPVGSVTVPYGALIEPKGIERDRAKFRYLEEMYECKSEVFFSATGGAKTEPEPVAEEPEPAPPPVAEKAEEPAAPAGPRLEWARLNSSDFSVKRAAVPGGWLVAVNASVIFVADADHKWDGGSVE